MGNSSLTPNSQPPIPNARYWLFWDGDCGFCRRGVVWVKKQDKAEKINAVSYQEAPRPPMTDALAMRCARAVHVITPSGQILSGGRASLCLLSVIGYRRFACLLALPPFVWFVEAGYWIVARNRRFFSRFLFRSASHFS
jgi:predicted DCC family thiol-disulfide oxidoreductase YuxK